MSICYPLLTRRPNGEAIVCNRLATTATFAAQVAAAVDGETICLATGDYGTWTGTNKTITIAPQPGANPIIALDLGTGDGNFTIDGGHTEISQSTNGMVRQMTPFTSSGIKIAGAAFLGTPGPQNITIKRCWFGPEPACGRYVNIDGPTNPHLVFDRCWFFQLSGGEACLQTFSSFVTVKNCLFEDGDADGCKLSDGTNMVIQDCEFLNIHPHGNAALHTDCIQWNGATASTVVRNLFLNFEQGCSGFDGMGSNVITDNAINNGDQPAAHWLTMGGDNPASTCNHNTITGSAVGGGNDPIIICGSKPADPLSITNLLNNAGEISLSGIAGGAAGVPTTNTHNMWPGAGSPNISGTPTFVGGANATTWQGYKLTSGSNGRNAANDGLDVGIRVA